MTPLTDARLAEIEAMASCHQRGHGLGVAHKRLADCVPELLAEVRRLREPTAGNAPLSQGAP